MPETWGICLGAAVQNHRAWRAELSSGKRNTIAVGVRKTQKVYWAPSLPPPQPPGAVENSLAQLHREEKPAGVELILAYSEELCEAEGSPLPSRQQSVVQEQTL